MCMPRRITADKLHSRESRTFNYHFSVSINWELFARRETSSLKTMSYVSGIRRELETGRWRK